MGSGPVRGRSRVLAANSQVLLPVNAKADVTVSSEDDSRTSPVAMQNADEHLSQSAARIPLRLQFTSDLHLEFLGSNPDEALLRAQLPEPAAPNLALLGDFGDPFSELYRRTLALLTTQWRTVIVLAGNHEYYQAAAKTTMSEVDEQIAAVCNVFPNVHFLNQGELWIDGTRLLGTTLWSALPEASRGEIGRHMNDCHMIFVEGEDNEKRPVTPKELHELHLSHVAWLHSALSAHDKNTQSRTVVLSHHAPSRAMLRGSKCNGSSLLAHAFFTDLEELVSNVAAWLSGHVHHCTSEHVGQHHTLCACNAVGYPNALRLPPGSEDPRYSKRAVLVVPPSGQVQLERPIASRMCDEDDYMADFLLFDAQGQCSA